MCIKRARTWKREWGGVWQTAPNPVSSWCCWWGHNMELRSVCSRISSLWTLSTKDLLLFQEGSSATADLCGASTAIPTPPWSFLKLLCLLIVAQLPSSVPPLCAGPIESRLEGDNTSWNAHLSQRERGGSQHPHGLLSCTGKKEQTAELY